jgi:ubiquinone/menaquinone biosynthesis C-methylase UbiE
MAGHPQLASVVAYYDSHPISAAQILEKLGQDGVPLAGLGQAVLKDYDQDHYGGVAATDALIARAGIGPAHHVLDVCSGLGGPARYLAHRLGCRVTGLDLTESRHVGAQALTRLVGLDHLVEFVLGDAQAMPFEAASFDVALSQEAWLHVPDKAKVVAECARVVRPGGVLAFTDLVQNRRFAPAAEVLVKRAVCAETLASHAGYRAMLAAAGWRIEQDEDLTAAWGEVLTERLAMYRSLKAQTVARLGEARYREWDAGYSAFVAAVVAGDLGGCRFVARRA